jgi:hypothetical protein
VRRTSDSGLRPDSQNATIARSLPSTADGTRARTDREVSRSEDIKMNRIEKVIASLADEGLSEAQLERVASILSANSPRRAYVWAVVFLGAATYVLSLGAILLRAAPDALWTAVGAGLGGLTGIFMGQHDG